jgi:hypothetical protein
VKRRFPRKLEELCIFSDSCNEPFGSRPEPGARMIAFILLLSPGEVPEGRARADQDTATSVQSESEGGGPVREPGVIGELRILPSAP